MLLDEYLLTIACVLFTHLSLNQEVSLPTYVLSEARNVDALLVLDLSNHAVYQDIGACAAHTSTGETQDKIVKDV